LSKGDILELYDWGKYDFSKENPGTRAAGARVCTWHYKNDKKNSYLELGGMRYSDWDGTPNGGGHRLVTTVIDQLGLKKYSVPFNESTNPLFYLRTRNMYLNDITSSNPAPYNVDHFGAATSPDNGFTVLQDLAVTPDAAGKMTRADWCQFYQNGAISVDMPDSSVYQKGDLMTDIGYWDLMFDQLGPEGFAYTADGNGYTSNIINWNSGDAIHIEVKAKSRVSFKKCAPLDATADIAEDLGQIPRLKVNAVICQRASEIGADRPQVEKIAAFRAGCRQSFRRLERYKQRWEVWATLILRLTQQREQDHGCKHCKPKYQGRSPGNHSMKIGAARL